MKHKYVVVDLETTGNSPARGDRIIQVGAVCIENGEIVSRFSSFVQPGIAIPPFIEQLTGITDDMVEDAPFFEEIAPSLLQMLDGAYFVAHNVSFDYSFLQGELENAGYMPLSMPLLDTVELSRILLHDADGYQLNQLADHLGISHTNPHQADSDAEVTAELLQHLLSKLGQLPLVALQRLQPVLRKLQSSTEQIVSELIAEKSNIISDDSGYDFYRQLVLKKVHRDLNNDEERDTGELSALSLREKLKQHMSQFEVRESQKKMMETVEEALENHQHAMIEAGTGVGKSLGYLIPGVLHSIRTGRPFVVSTHTVQLQQQILDRDVPILQKIMPFPFHAAVLKGRSHYLCLRKFEHSLQDDLDDNYDTNLTKAQILVWLTETEHGDVEELNLSSGGRLFWQQVRSDANSCLGHRCPWFSRCFYHRKRRQAQSADLVITNHAMLFTDLKADSQLLPAYKEAVVDEAHHLEEVVSDHFGTQTDYFAFHRLLERLGTTDSSQAAARLSQLADLLEIPRSSDVFSDWNEKMADLKQELDDMFRLLKLYVLNGAKASAPDTGKVFIRYSREETESRNFAPVLEMFDRCSSMIRDLLKRLQKISKAVADKDDHLNFQQKGFMADLAGLRSDLEEEMSSLSHLLYSPLHDEVYWMEADIRGARHAVWLYAKPVEIDDILADEFFAKKKSVILTSATISVRNSFRYMIDRLGLADFGPVTSQLPSPFRYDRQVRLMIPSDLPLISECDAKTFTSMISRSLFEIAKVTKGRMLVLFTSYEMLKETHTAFKQLMDEDEFMLIAQGIDSGSRARLTKNFKKFDHAILFGTSSFWEGIDIPGDSLTCLCIVRLPFSPPDNPVTNARSEKIRAAGGNPFYDLSLPQAIIRFKQGFGRLVRSQSDYGAVFVFDRRITETRYGRSFLSSLPKLPVDVRPLGELTEELDRWLMQKEEE
ncbi:ATP-dependent DNA helicase DinG [Fictibacillus aquaticus]|uniref:3'-5' exonuclease DinG n=1 Tax=Fictibacillus aquaticus TaxID=2021314 RepID=A0A235FBZ2_9BACL|nr:ATP-dependent DNA helicase DinG [Fictibacillus aquaticus]OYD58554.1 ATP-dependent helicase DinG [Fictibacillus aquaticus]